MAREVDAVSVKKLKPRAGLRFESGSREVIDEEAARILRTVNEEKSLTRAAERLNVSYKYLWNKLRVMEERLGRPLVTAKHGGFGGGGSANLTSEGSSLVAQFDNVQRGLQGIVEETGFWEAIGLRLSARNRLFGIVEEVKKGPVAAHVKISVNHPVTITALITREAADDLSLNQGEKIHAFFKATDVVLGKQVSQTPTKARRGKKK